jgi:very-short-patch-repair endonuclease
VALELDGRRAHQTRSAFEADRRRDRLLTVAGWRPVRVTWRHLDREADELEADLRSLLR